MNNHYQAFFGFTSEVFRSDLKKRELLQTEELMSVKNRFDYAVRLGGTALVTGDIGSGKSTALRFASDSLHESEYRVFYITAGSGPIQELYSQIIQEMGMLIPGRSKALMAALIRKEVTEIVDNRKIKPILIIDEASHLRLDVLSELHTITQYQKDSRHCLPVILAGQSSLIDNLMYRTSASLASRVITRSHLEGLDRNGMQQYIAHHLNLAGVKHNIFDDAAITAVHQGSGGLLRKANHLARGSLIAAAMEKSQLITPEHVRIAATEVF